MSSIACSPMQWGLVSWKKGGTTLFLNDTKTHTSIHHELKIFQALLELHRCAGKHDDAQLTDFLEGNYLKEQVEAQKEIGDLITKVCHFIASIRKLAFHGSNTTYCG